MITAKNYLESASFSFLASFAVGTILTIGGPATIATALTAGVSAGAVGVLATTIHAATTPIFNMFAESSGNLKNYQELVRRQLVIIGVAVITSYTPTFFIKVFATAFFDLIANLTARKNSNIAEGAVFVPLLINTF